MPTWAWVTVLFVGMTMAYWCGVALGAARADAAPTPMAWLKAREYDCDTRKEIAMRSIELEHEWEMQALNRGIYDRMPFEPEEDEDDNNPGDWTVTLAQREERHDD